MDMENVEGRLLKAIFGGDLKTGEQMKNGWKCPYCEVIFPKYGNSEGMLRKRSITHLKKVHGLILKDIKKILFV